jgi:hypothetical protein
MELASLIEQARVIDAELGTQLFKANPAPAANQNPKFILPSRPTPKVKPRGKGSQRTLFEKDSPDHGKVRKALRAFMDKNGKTRVTMGKFLGTTASTVDNILGARTGVSERMYETLEEKGVV